MPPAGVELGRSAWLVLHRNGRRQDRKPFLGTLPFFDFDLLDEDAWRHGRDGHPAGFRSAASVEDRGVITRGEDFGEARERRADDVHAANQFVLPAIGIDTI